MIYLIAKSQCGSRMYVMRASWVCTLPACLCAVRYTTRHLAAMKYPATTCTALTVVAFASCISSDAFLFRPVLEVGRYRSSSSAGVSRSTCSSCPQTSFRASSRADSVQQTARRGHRRLSMQSGTRSLSWCLCFECNWLDLEFPTFRLLMYAAACLHHAIYVEIKHARDQRMRHV